MSIGSLYSKDQSQLQSSAFELNRLSIIGKITSDTPFCVLSEVANSIPMDIEKEHLVENVYLNEVLKGIKKFRAPTVIGKNDKDGNLCYDDTDLQNICVFLNYEETKWRSSNILIAFNHTLTFMNVKEPPLPSSTFTFGKKTNNNPLAYDACMLYRLCTYYSIKTTRTTLIQHMANAITNYSKSTTELRKMIELNLSGMKKSALINLLLMPELSISPSPNIKPRSTSKQPIKTQLDLVKVLPNINTSSVTSADIEVAYRDLTNIDYYLPLIHPSSQEETIAITAAVYGINLVQCINPYLEYIEIKRQSLSGSIYQHAYIPTNDMRFRKMYINNPKFFDVRLTWEPKLNFLYRREDLIDFLLFEGYSVLDDHDNYEDLLYQNRCQPTFYSGRNPECTFRTTSIYIEDIDTIDDKLIIVYGNLETNEFDLYSVNELTDYFDRGKTFINASNTKTLFTDTNINKLKNICTQFIKSEKDDTEVYYLYRRLLSVIDEVIKINLTIIDQGKEFKMYYINSHENIKSTILELFRKVLYVGYYMRGWKVRGDYKISLDELPISSLKTTFDIDKTEDVFMNTSIAIIDFEKYLSDVDSRTKAFFLKLPLLCVKIEGTKCTYTVSNDESKGFTIYERIMIAKSGEGDASCIRMTSNWLLASAYYYITLLDNVKPFNILDMCDIS